MSDPSKAVFLSYASQDAEAAWHICEALRAAGVEVWFDQSELRGGDAWDAQIRKRIKECALFVPVISANTNARPEGYFRLEWKLAVDRSHLLADDHPFLFPIVIGDVADATARVPDKFRDVQWTRLKLDETPAELAKRVARLLSGVAGAVDPGPASARPAAKKSKPSWLGYAWAAVGILFALVYALRPMWQPARPKEAKPAATVTSPAAAPQTEAQKLVAQARQVYENGDELNRENLFFADDLLKRALALDPADPEAWELSAALSYTMVWHSIDNSEQRRNMLTTQAARAQALAPESVPARLAVINARLAMNFATLATTAADLERELLTLAALTPQDWRVQGALGSAYRFLGRSEESVRALRRAVELSGGHPRAAADLVNVLMRLKRCAEAEGVVAAALPGHPTGRLLTFDVIFKLRWRGDAAASRQAVATWPTWLLQEDRGVFLAWQTALWSREPQRALSAAQGTQRDYVRDFNFYGPRAVLTAWAHELAGHAEAARADWQAVLVRVERELAAEPEDEAALYWKAWALARLGQTAEAQSIAARLQQRNQAVRTAFFKSTYLAPLLVTVGQTDAALAELKTGLAAFDDSLGITRSMLELDPAYDPLRSDPRFRELLEAAAAPVAAPSPISQLPSPASPPPVDSKSVAVLAFANLSDDKDNEYFSDGISEELLNVLAKIPDLKVTARTSSFHFKGTNTAIPEIAKQLGVAYVVEGSVRKQGTKVRITAQLIKAADGFHVWSDTFTRELKDIFAVQDEIAGLIAKNLELKMGASTSPLVNADAMQLYLQGRQAWNLRTVEGHNRAEQLLNQAIALEPKFARAHAALSDVWALRGEITEPGGGTYGWRNSPTLLRAAAKAEQAVGFDPESAEAHASLGLVRLEAARNQDAVRELERAVALNPNYATGHHWLGEALMAEGRMDEGLASLARAAELDPLSHRILDNWARGLYLAGRPQAALAATDRALALQPGAIQARLQRGFALAKLGRLDEAAVIARSVLPEKGIRAAFSLIILGQAGQRAEVVAVLADPVLGARPDVRFLGNLALGRTEAALAAMKPEDLNLTDVNWLLFDPAVDPLRADPRFLQVIATVGLTEAHVRAQAWRAAHPPEKSEAKK